jgi:pyruvate/2-oxoglutarate dehydrogenase complex dihydrolipoamide acyltransferase (E2) component
MSEERIQVWHFVRADHTTGEGLLKVEVGQTLTVEGPLELCKHGLHGSRKVLDALWYAPGPVACQDEIWGDIIEDNNKLCGRYRKCLAMIDATTVLHEFACLCAERALTREREMGREPDPRSWAAIEAKRQWLRREIDDAKLAAAWDAAGDTAWAAATAASAAVSAAWAAAAAAAAAASAARDAAWAAPAARVAARDAERDWQDAKLTRMLEEEIRRANG